MQDRAVELAKDFLKEARTKHAIEEAYLFGSYARRSNVSYSDIDIAVVLGRVGMGSYSEEAFEIFHEAQEYNSLLVKRCRKHPLLGYRIHCHMKNKIINE